MKAINFRSTLVFTFGNHIIYHPNQSTPENERSCVNNYAGTTGKTPKCFGKIRTYINLIRAFQDSHDQIGILVVREL